MSALRRRQAVGVVASLLLIAATGLWAANGRPLPLPEVEVTTPTVKVSANKGSEPQVVKLARKALDRDLPAKLSYRGDEINIEHVDDRRAIVCAPDSSCALVERGNDLFLVNTTPQARRILIEAAEEGEPR